ncbi:hypothetical protein PAXINDRAFT_22074 [Paxillus involutus ATCC 200175]|uniref:Uncharacterized protein n=1 Tax=Paxillus involutus ATCC 200175 TaxID=664439 RepID=A0A0C9T8R6_PAXIN|nr:hypothetical protein PAXINDRAFT_22074 [Paxillus involutus ATCC 200175]
MRSQNTTSSQAQVGRRFSQSRGRKTPVFGDPPSTPERPPVNSSIQHPLKRKSDDDLSNCAVAKHCVWQPPLHPREAVCELIYPVSP